MTNKYIDRVKSSFSTNKNKVFLTEAKTGKTFTYAEIELFSSQLASFIKTLGIKKGDHAAVFLPNCAEYVLLYFAFMRVGIVPVPINQRLQEDEVNFILSNSDAKFLFTSPSLKDSIKGINKNIKVISFTPYSREDSSDNLFKMMKNEKLAKVPIDVSDEDVAIIAYTSGTTGRPKGLVLSYRSLFGNASSFIEFTGIQPDLKFFNALSQAYMAGLYNLTWLPFLAGCSVVLDEQFSPASGLRFWETVKKYKANATWFVPSILSFLMTIDRSNVGIDYCKKNFKLAFVGTAPLPRQLKEKFEEKYHLELYENYGLSEVLFISTNSPTLPANRGVGKPIPGCSVSVVDESGKPMGRKQTGELVVSSEHIFNGYYKNHEETQRLLKSGKVHTGDVGFIDDEGYVYITDRKKDLIIRGGINIGPKEIEEVILASDMVEETAVVGISDELQGEEVVAVINPKKNYDEEKLRNHCKIHLAHFKMPARFIIMKEFPRSVTGKVQKNEIRKMISKA